MTSGSRRAASSPASGEWSRRSHRRQSCAVRRDGVRPKARRAGVRQSVAATSRPCWHLHRPPCRSPCSQAPRPPRARSAPAAPAPVRSSEPAPPASIIKEAIAAGETFRARSFESAYACNDVDHRRIKPRCGRRCCEP